MFNINVGFILSGTGGHEWNEYGRQTHGGRGRYERRERCKSSNNNNSIN